MGTSRARDAAARIRSTVRGAYLCESVEGIDGFVALGCEWDALLATGPVDQPFVRHAFIRAWLDAFARDARLTVVVARDAAGRAAGMAPLLEARRGGLTCLESPANDHSGRAEWALGDDPEGAVHAIWCHLRDRMRWDVLVLRDVPRHGPTSSLVEAAAERDRHLVGRRESLRSPYLALGGQTREAKVSSKFLSNLRRRMRRLQEQGAVAYRRVDGGEAEVDAFLFDFFALEAAGWKGAHGTAIAQDVSLVAFYRAVARAAAREGWLALRALELDGRPVAAHFGLRHRGVYSFLKPAYDEALAACSPGQLLFREVLAECEARRLFELDFLGQVMPWKLDWAPQLRQHDWLYVYRPGLAGTALHALRHRVRPVVKEVLSWVRH